VKESNSITVWHSRGFGKLSRPVGLQFKQTAD